MAHDHDDSILPNGSEAPNDAAPKITLKSSAARIKKPPFGGPARVIIQTASDPVLMD